MDPGSKLHEKLLLLRLIGLTPREAMSPLRRVVPTVYGWKDVGKIEVGRVADFLLLDRDPQIDLSAVEEIHTVVLNGKVITSGL